MSAAKTTAERQRAYRERKAAEQLQEVRGVFAHPEDIPAIRTYAARLAKRRERARKEQTQ